MNDEQIERTLLEMLSSCGSRLPPEQVLDMRDLAEHREGGIALENLCTQLFEYDIHVPPAVMERIREVGEAMRVSPDYWERLTPEKPR